MSRTVIYLGLGALLWIGTYAGSRNPPGAPFGQFRESPMFRPKSRPAAAAAATVVAGLATAFLFLA